MVEGDGDEDSQTFEPKDFQTRQKQKTLDRNYNEDVNSTIGLEMMMLWLLIWSDHIQSKTSNGATQVFNGESQTLTTLVNQIITDHVKDPNQGESGIRTQVSTQLEKKYVTLTVSRVSHMSVSSCCQPFRRQCISAQV